MSEENVHCNTHGETPPTFICEHLKSAEGKGFHLGYTGEHGDQLYPDAWCADCEAAFQKHGEWNEHNEPNISLVCAYCYIDAAEKNWADDNESFDKLIAESHDMICRRQENFLADYGINDCERYDFDDETGKLTFSKDGKIWVECSYDVVGTFSQTSDTWMWAWGNQSMEPKVKNNSLSIRRIGHDLGVRKLAMGHWRANETDGWEMTSIMGKQLNAIGVYRTKHDNMMRFMIIREAIKVKKKRFGLF